VHDLLAARGISLPYGDPADPPDRETVCGLGNRKGEDVRARLAAGGLRAFPDAQGFLRSARAAGLRLAVVSASRNATVVLSAVRLRDRFDILVDGVVAQELGLPGKPDPASLLEAARRLGATAAGTIVVENAVTGVEAGRRGGFGLVVGVARTGSPERLRAAGADAVVGDLGRLVPEPALVRTSR
jgi:alpha,alpha-trehalase